MTDKPTVTQADLDAAQALCVSGWTHASEAFARHRIAAEKSRDDVIEECVVALQWFVDRKWALQAKFDLHGPADTANAMREILKRSEEALRAMKGTGND